jgi:hypothetical protein
MVKSDSSGCGDTFHSASGVEGGDDVGVETLGREKTAKLR